MKRIVYLFAWLFLGWSCNHKPELQPEYNVSIFPQPATDVVYIMVQNNRMRNQPPEQIKVKFFAHKQSENQEFQSTDPSPQFHISLVNVPEGVYSVEITKGSTVRQYKVRKKKV